MFSVSGLFNFLWSLKSKENRNYFFSMLRNYMGGVRRAKYLQDITDTPYTSELTQLVSTSKILLVVHEFSRTGAPYAVLYLAQALFSIHGVRPVVLSAKDGPLHEEYKQQGFLTIVDPLLFTYRSYSSEVCRLVASFDRVIVTSLACFDFINYFRGIGKRLTWWIHETDVGFTATTDMGADLSLLFASCESIWLGSPLCFPIALKFTAQDKLYQLVYGCPDTARPNLPNKSGKILFSIIASVEMRKGQDVFIDAINLLPEKIRSTAIFRIIGSPLPENDRSADFYKEVCANAALIPEVQCYENMSLDMLQEFYAETDVFVSASRDDPMPIVITQGLMFSKVCLCSSAIGQAQLLEDKNNGLIFTNESSLELSEKIAWILRNSAKLFDLGKEGRDVYKKHFLMRNFTGNVERLLKDRQGSIPTDNKYG